LPLNADFLEFAVRVATAAGDAILPHFRESIAVEDKGGARGYDPVTVADRAAEAVIRAEIARVWPDHGIHGEEHGREQGSSPYTWVIDPIDGTKSFILGQLHWATLIALHDGTRPVLGVAHQPFVGETFVGMIDDVAEWRRGGARRTLKNAPMRDAKRCDRRHHRSPPFRRFAPALCVQGRHGRRAFGALWRRLLLLHAARDGIRGHRHRNGIAALRRAGADPAHRGGGRTDHELAGRAVRPGRRRPRLWRPRSACGAARENFFCVKLLVLGGTRFLGRHFVDAALACGHAVTLFTRAAATRIRGAIASLR
jgi:fructose-1,6-bisphosphatase/inositol monophosphatase family enzyme